MYTNNVYYLLCYINLIMFIISDGNINDGDDNNNNNNNSNINNNNGVNKTYVCVNKRYVFTHSHESTRILL